MKSKTDLKDYREIAKELNVSESDIKSVVNSFFESIEKKAKQLPFDNHRKIFKRNKFIENAFAVNIPFIGRLGPVYSRYLSWRKNESSKLPQSKKPKSKRKLTQDEIEELAEKILSGEKVQIPNKHDRTKSYDVIWIVDKDGRKHAKQVILNKDGI